MASEKITNIIIRTIQRQITYDSVWNIYIRCPTTIHHTQDECLFHIIR